MEHTVKEGQSLVLCVQKAISKSATDKRVSFGNVWFPKISHPPRGRLLEIPREGVFPKPKVFEGKCEAKVEFLGGVGGGGLSGMQEAGKWLFSGTKQ